MYNAKTTLFKKIPLIYPPSYLLPSVFSMSMMESFNFCFDSSVLQLVVRFLIALVIVISISELSSLNEEFSPSPLLAEVAPGDLRVEAESEAMVGICVWPTVITGMLRSSSGRENCSRSGTTSEVAEQ